MTTASAFAEPLIGAIDRIIACMDGLDAEGINWKPPAPETNSLYVLAVHMTGTTEQSIIGVLGGEEVHRDRDAEFAAVGESTEWIHQRWADLKPKIRQTLETLTEEDLARVYEHPRRGPRTGLGLLIFITNHANEHVGHAELTRDMLKAL